MLDSGAADVPEILNLLYLNDPRKAHVNGTKLGLANTLGLVLGWIKFGSYNVWVGGSSIWVAY